MEKLESVRDRIKFDHMVVVPKELAVPEKIAEVLRIVDGKNGCMNCCSGDDILIKIEEKLWRDMRNIFKDDVVVNKNLELKELFDGVKVM